MAVKVVCDFCDKPLKIEDCRCLIYRTKIFDTQMMLPHLCEECARKLDDIFEELTNKHSSRSEIINRYYKMNKERRERLGTQG